MSSGHPIKACSLYCFGNTNCREFLSLWCRFIFQYNTPSLLLTSQSFSYQVSFPCTKLALLTNFIRILGLNPILFDILLGFIPLSVFLPNCCFKYKPQLRTQSPQNLHLSSPVPNHVLEFYARELSKASASSCEDFSFCWYGIIQ